VPETVVQVPPAPLGDEIRNFSPSSQVTNESMSTPTPSMQQNVVPVPFHYPPMMQQNVVPVPVHYPPMMQPGGVSVNLPQYPPTTQTAGIYAPSYSSPMLVNCPTMTQQAGISQPSQYPTMMPHAVPGPSYQYHQSPTIPAGFSASCYSPMMQQYNGYSVPPYYPPMMQPGPPYYHQMTQQAGIPPSKARAPYRSAASRINGSSLHDLTNPAPSITALLDLRQLAPGLAAADKYSKYSTVENYIDHLDRKRPKVCSDVAATATVR
jgi:hypothetical protein